jgi:PHD/YefM family antitoxin component YafN of YafNO toxin-antitoxin module
MLSTRLPPLTLTVDDEAPLVEIARGDSAVILTVAEWKAMTGRDIHSEIMKARMARKPRVIDI